MRTVAVLALAIAMSAAAGRPPQVKADPADWIQLFDGKTLDGWVWYQRPPKTATQPAVVPIDQVWSVKDGVLHTKGKPTGYIRTIKDFPGSYVLTVEFRHIAKGNGGILFALTGEDKIWPRCLEVQAANGEEGDIRNIADFKMTMDESRVEPKRLRRLGPNPEKPVGEWETIRIIADHGNLAASCRTSRRRPSRSAAASDCNPKAAKWSFAKSS